MSEVIGSVAVEIVGDYSGLQSDFDAAVALAVSKGATLGEAINAALSLPDTTPLTDALALIGSTSDATAGQLSSMASAMDAVSTAAQNYAGSAESIIQAQKDADEELATAQQALTAIQALYDSGSASANDLARAAQAVQSAFDAANPSLETAATDAKSAGDAFAEFASQMALVAGALAFTDGLISFGEAALKASDDLTRADIALTTITGDAAQAQTTIAGLRELGNSDGLAFPSLLTAATRMQQLLPAGADVVGELAKIADGAAVMGTSIEAAANSFDRIVAGGQASARTLIPLGLSLSSLADALNEVKPDLDATADSAAKAFKALEPGDRITVLNTALEGLAGTANKIATETFGGQWQTMANQVTQVMEEIGAAITPVISDLNKFISTDVIPGVQAIVSAFRELPQPVQDVAVALGLIAAAAVPVAAALGAIGLAIGGLATLTETVGTALAALGVEVEAVGAVASIAAPLVLAFGAAFAILDFSGFLGGLENLTSAVKDFVTGLDPSVWAPISDAIDAIKTSAIDTVSAFSGWDSIKGIAESLEAEFPPIKTALDEIAAAAKEAGASFSWWDLIAPGAHAAGDAMNAAATDLNVYNEATKVSNALNNDFITNLGRVFDAMNRLKDTGAASAIQSYDDTVQSILTHQVDLTQKLTDTKNALDLITQAYQAGTAVNASGYIPSLKDVAAAQQAVDAASTALYGKQQTLKDTTVQLVQATHDLANYTGDALDPTNNLSAAEAALASNVDKTQTSVLHANANLQAAVDALNAIKDAAANGTAGLGDVEQAENNVAAAAAKLETAQKAANAALLAIENANVATALASVNEALSQTGADAIIAGDNLKDLENDFPQLAGAVGSAAPAMDGINKALIDFGANAQNAGKPIPDLKAGIDGLIGEIPQLTQAFQNGQISQDQYDKGLALLGTDIGKMAKDDLPGAIKAWGDLVSAQVAAHASIGVIQSDLSSWEGAIQKLATTDLPAAIAAQQQYLDQLAKIPGSYQLIIQGQENMLAEEIKWAQMSGQDASLFEISLDKLHDKISGAGNDSLYQAYKDLQQVNKDTFDQLDKAFGDLIVDGGKFGDKMVEVGKSIAKELIDDVLKLALQPLQSSLKELINSLFPAAQSAASATAQGISGLAGQASACTDTLQVFGVTSGAASTANTVLTGTSGTTSGALGALGVAATLASISMWSMVGAIAGIIGAIAGIVGDVYLAAIDTKLFTVETDLNEIFQETTNRRKDAWDQFNSTYGRLGEIINWSEQIFDKMSTISITAGGGLTPDQSAALKESGDAAPVMVADLNVIAANTAYTFGKLVDIWGELDVAFRGNSIYDMLAEINSSVLAVVTAIDYGTQSGKSYSDQSAEASQALAQDVTNSGMSAHSDLSKVDTSIQQGTAAGRTNTQLTVDQQIAKRNDDIAAAQAAANGALNIASQIDALRTEYSADIAAMNDALRAGNIDLATQYQHAAAAVQAQITPLLSSTATNTANTAAYVQDAGNQVGIAATGAGVLVSTAVQNSAATISQAVINSAAASASLFNTGLSQLVSTVGAFGKVGGGLPGGQTGLPSGSGLGNTNPNGTPTYSVPGVSNPGVINGEQPGFNPNAPITGGMTQAQWNATGHNGLAPDWWLAGTPQPGINQSNLPHFLTGGGVDVGGLAIVDSGEVVIPSDIAAAVKSGEAVVSSPHINDPSVTGGSIFTPSDAINARQTVVPVPPQGSPDDPNFVDHGPSTDDSYWTKMAAAIAAGFALPKPGVSVTDVNNKPSVEVTAVSDGAAAAISTAINKTPIVDPILSDQAKQIAVLQQAANDAQAQLIAANKSGDAAKIQAAQQQVAIATNALNSAQQQAQQQTAATIQLAAINQAILADQATLAQAQMSGDATKIAIAQKSLATEQSLLVSAMAQQSSVTAIANGPMNKTPIVDPAGQPVQIVTISAAAIAAMQGNQGGAVQSGPSQQDLLAASMNWLNSQQGLSAGDIASATSTYQNDAKAGLLPSPKSSGAGFSGYNPYSTPSFDVGGLVSADMLAMVHAGEWVIPANGKVLLPPEVMARIQMPTIPGAPHVPDVPISTSGGGSNDSYSFNIYGITDPDLLMREISSRVKTRTGRTAKFSN